jgi:hypothetical protein
LDRTIYQITLPEEQDAEAFERFMLDEVFPAIDKSPRRDGQVTGLVLLRGNNPDNINEYLCLVHGHGGTGGALEQRALHNISASRWMGARVSTMGDWYERGRWFAENAATD